MNDIKIKKRSARYLLMTVLWLLSIAACATMNPYGSLPPSRIDKSLTPDNIPSEISISPARARMLLKQARDSQIFSSESGLSKGAANPIEMAPMKVSGKLGELFQGKPKPGASDLKINFEELQATVTIGNGDNAMAWPIESSKSVKAVYGLSHTKLLGGTPMEPYIEGAAKAASLPFVVVVSDNELLLLQNEMTQTSQSKSKDVLGESHRSSENAFRTNILPVDFTQVSSTPLGDFVMVLTAETVDMVLAKYKVPQVWLLPVKDDEFDGNRFGYTITLSKDLTETSGIPGLVQIQSFTALGYVTRVKLAGGTASWTAPEKSKSTEVVPGSAKDPLLQRNRTPSEPQTWGVSGTGAGGAGLDFPENGVGPTYLGNLTGWYGSQQVMLDFNPRYMLGSALYRITGARDTNYFGVGLSVGSYDQNFAMGPRIFISNYEKFYGMKLVQDFTADVVFGKKFAVNILQSYSLRYSLGNGAYILPGGYLNLGLSPETHEEPGNFDMQVGLQVKVLFNGNHNP
jgi:hypothetical protein